jgi:hydrogenase small subunit
VVNCNIVERGAINHMGGCMRAGGVCIGCTMPGFPDRFSPFYSRPPGALLSTSGAKVTGFFVRPLRRLTQEFQNRERRWDESERVPTGWGHVREPSRAHKVVHYFYDRWRHLGVRGKR